ncbi:MAG: hypothetical protein R6V31_00465, partial [Halohasta sp.]
EYQDDITIKQSDQGVTSPTTFNETLSGLESGRDYDVTAFTENDDIDPPVNATGDRVGFTVPE